MLSVAGTGRQACQLDQRLAAVWIHCEPKHDLKALAMIDGLNITGYQASNTWCTRVLRCSNLAHHQKGKIAQMLLVDLEENIVNFHRFLLNCRKKANYELVNFGNMDKIPVLFDMPSARTGTVNTRGEKTVSIITTGQEKSHFTVTLSCLAVVQFWHPLSVVTLRSRRERIQGHLSAHARTKPIRADQSAGCCFHPTENISWRVRLAALRELFK